MADEQNSSVKTAREGDRLSGEQRIAYLERKLERFRESHEKKDRKAREWMAEIEGEIAELKSSLVS